MDELLYYDLKKTAGLTPSLATQVCRELGRRIVAGNLRETELIDDENALCERYGVSKSVVREAVKMLASKGLLEVRRGSGTRVRRRASWNLLDDDVLAWHQGIKPRPDFLRQLTDVRLIIEPNAAAWAAEFATAEQLADISAALQQMENATTAQDFVVADASFHRAILRAANNELLMAMEGVIFSALLQSMALTNSTAEENKTSIPFHRDVAEAIKSRDSEKAAALMKQLLVDAQSRLSNKLKQSRATHEIN